MVKAIVDFNIVSTSKSKITDFLKTLLQLAQSPDDQKAVDLHRLITPDRLDPHPTAATSSEAFSIYNTKTLENNTRLESVISYFGFSGPVLINISRNIRKRLNYEVSDDTIYLEDLCKKYNSAIEIWIDYFQETNIHEHLIITKGGDVRESQSVPYTINNERTFEEEAIEGGLPQIGFYETEETLWNYEGEGETQITEYWAK